jgi:hypothetical protein
MNRAPIEFQYTFRSSHGDSKLLTFQISLEPASLTHRLPESDSAPDWARLDYHKCKDCPLDSELHSHCPAALALSAVVQRFQELLSYDSVEVTVVTPQRTVSGETTAQRAISSLMGLYLATSGCPILAKLKPMARFHLPLANREETLFRAASTYLLGQYLLKQKGLPADFDLTGLRELYSQIHTINIALAERLRVLTSGDANLNAIVLLDLFAQELPMSLDGKLGDFTQIFEPYFHSAIEAAMNQETI